MVYDTIVYALGSVFFVSLISLIGVLTIFVKKEILEGTLTYLVSFSAGGLFGNAFIHLLPEAVEAGFEISISLYVLSGIVLSFIVEKFISWRHCHIPTSEEHPHPFAYMNLVGDGVHNFIDGLVIGGSYIMNIPLGAATTLAVAIHEIPQEIGDFGVLLHGGFSRSKALLYNFLTAVAAIVGAVFSLFLTIGIETFTVYLLPFAAGEFTYIAGSDLLPELHKETSPTKSVIQLLAFTSGILLMLMLRIFMHY